ncbi:hypothetical protein SDC9_77214 [bioreactor metagenome]|uniref:Uncharacterized protein n=1 Tax=bioreactor metagenome TaxID=1076179 RepID=A0A644YXE7_9ZZZZ
MTIGLEKSYFDNLSARSFILFNGFVIELLITVAKILINIYSKIVEIIIMYIILLYSDILFELATSAKFSFISILFCNLLNIDSTLGATSEL